jgi:hypothetical protein
MFREPTLILNGTGAIASIFLSSILSKSVGLHPALWSFGFGAALLICFQRWDIAVLMFLPLLIIVPTSIYLANFRLDAELLRRLLITKDYSVVTSRMHLFYAYYFVPFLIFAPAVRPMSIISDLQRYNIWRFRFVSTPAMLLVEVILIRQLGDQLFSRIADGLAARYIVLNSFRSKMQYLPVWSRMLVRSLLATALQRKHYLDVTGIRLDCLLLSAPVGPSVTELIACSFLAAAVCIWLLF